MTTKDEFLKILDALYNDGYVLVRIHDIAYETTDENGNPAFTWGNGHAAGRQKAHCYVPG